MAKQDRLLIHFKENVKVKIQNKKHLIRNGVKLRKQNYSCNHIEQYEVVWQKKISDSLESIIN